MCIVRSLIIILLLIPKVLAADANLCDRAAKRAAEVSNVPLDVMLALTRTETGRGRNGGIEPWPWTVNIDGKGHWFESRQAATRFVYDQFMAGARSFDVGCFQINYKWHGAAFASIEAMFEPDKNAAYAARFLRSLKEESETWLAAVGAYHSRTPTYAARYTERYKAIYAGLSDNPPSMAPVPQAPGYPLLLVKGSAARLGSLVHLENTSRQSIIQRRGEG